MDEEETVHKPWETEYEKTWLVYEPCTCVGTEWLLCAQGNSAGGRGGEAPHLPRG